VHKCVSLVVLYSKQLVCVLDGLQKVKIVSKPQEIVGYFLLLFFP